MVLSLLVMLSLKTLKKFKGLLCKAMFPPLQLVGILSGNTLALYRYHVPEKSFPNDFSNFALNNYFIGGFLLPVFYVYLGFSIKKTFFYQ